LSFRTQSLEQRHTDKQFAIGVLDGHLPFRVRVKPIGGLPKQLQGLRDGMLSGCGKIWKRSLYISLLTGVVMSFQPRFVALISCFIACTFYSAPAPAQVAPSATELRNYSGLHAAAALGDVRAIEKLIAAGENKEAVDARGRTPLHVAIYQRQYEAALAFIRLGADPNKLDADRYDIVTIASVANDVPGLKIALDGGGKATNITSRYDGTALIAAAHLGHVDVVKMLIAAKAPLDHVNNLKWTALIESIVLGDGGRNHTETLRTLIRAGANVNIANGSGETPLTLARSRDYSEMVAILEGAGAK